MDWTTLTNSVLSTQTPALPAPVLAHVYLMLSWALVLGGLAAWLAGRWQRESVWPQVIGGVVLLWCLLPGPWSPAYWLGLAFRAPSLTSVLLCGWLLWQQRRPADARWAQGKIGLYAAACGIALGWLLLLDTFAFWPVSLYALGFSPAALASVALLVCLPWLAGTRINTGWSWLGLALGLLLAHVLLRVPTGNLWDALLDPLLWAALQLYALRCLWRSWRHRTG